MHVTGESAYDSVKRAFPSRLLFSTDVNLGWNLKFDSWMKWLGFVCVISHIVGLVHSWVAYSNQNVLSLDHLDCQNNYTLGSLSNGRWVCYVFHLSCYPVHVFYISHCWVCKNLIVFPFCIISC